MWEVGSDVTYMKSAKRTYLCKFNPHQVLRYALVSKWIKELVLIL